MSRIAFRFTLFTKLLPALALLLPALSVDAAPTIAVSIKPLQLIANAVTDGVTTAEPVWSQVQDPHHMSLRPSERRMLGAADLILWVGPMLEQPLASLVRTLDAETVTVQDLPGLVLLDVDGEPDPHVWVDTRNARLIAIALADTLARIDPANAARYRSNLETFDESVLELSSDIATRLERTRALDWAVYHHALRYLEQEFALRAPLTLADSENNAPGIRTALRVREQLQQGSIDCMLTEPGVNHDEVLTMLNLPTLRMVDVDVMGLDAGVTDYANYMQHLATTVAECVEPAP